MDHVRRSACGYRPAGGRQEVRFAIDESLVSGVYRGEVTAVAGGGQGVAVCDLYVAVSCYEPLWIVNPDQFEHTMTMVAAVDIGGLLSTDTNDRVSAWVGGQLRGVASIDSVPGLANPFVSFLTIYSNRSSGEMVRFQVWDDSECKLYNSTLESHPFLANDVIGSASAPDTLTATEVLGSGSLEIAVNDGWTWISTNVNSVTDMSVTGVLSDLVPAVGDIIKSQTAFSQFVDDSTGWSGSLIEIDNVSGYMLKLSSPGRIVHTGTHVDTLVPVKQGWNWISYLPWDPIAVADALADLESRGLVTDGDLVKSQYAFAEYNASAGKWYGSLNMMAPGLAYKLHLAGAVDSSFAYPDSTTPAPSSIVMATGAFGGPKDAVGVTGGASPVEGAPVWSVNPHAYEFNMTVTAVLRIDNRESIDENDIVGVFVDESCRGTARPVYVDGVGRHELFLLICSNMAAGEVMALRAFDADAGLIFDITDELVFEADKVTGTVQHPVVLTAGSLHQDVGQGVPLRFALMQNYPNPFNPNTMIVYDVPAGGGQVTLRVYDVGGRLVRKLVDRPETPGRKTVTWDGRDNRGQLVATGVYFYRMTAPAFEQTRKMIMLK